LPHHLHCLICSRHRSPPLFPYTTLFRSPLGVVEELESDVASLDHVKQIQTATPNRGADMAVVAVIPEGGPTDQSTKDLDLLDVRSEEHTSELQSRFDLVCRLLLEKKNKI